MIEILAKYSFKFNSCLARRRGTASAAEEYMKKKYPYLTMNIPSREKLRELSWNDRNPWNDISVEEHDDQIEFAVLQTFKAYDEICEMLKTKWNLMVSGFIRDVEINENIPKEVEVIITTYIEIKLNLPDNYKDN